MASIRERTSNGGKATSYAVLYRHVGRQTSMTFARRKDAKAFKELVENPLIGPAKALAMLADEPDGVTVDELAERFFAWKARDVTERTMTDYRRDYANWIKPKLGSRAAESIDEGVVQRWVDQMATRLSPKSVADRHMLLHSMYQFGRAKSRGLVTHNPCLETDLPRRKKRAAPKGTTTPEFRAIHAAAIARKEYDAADLILFLGETGWRWSEAAALDVRDVEDDGENIWVTVTRVFRIDGAYRQVIVEDEAKSAAALRRMRVLPDTATMLRRRVTGRGPGQLVFINPQGRQWSQNTFLRETWPRIVGAAQLGDRKPTPHWLRHMAVAVLAASGAPMHEIQRRIGHENYSTTVDVYGGMIGDISDDALEQAAALMRGERSAPSIAPVVAGEIVQALEDEAPAVLPPLAP